jgi:hypothetical protein
VNESLVNDFKRVLIERYRYMPKVSPDLNVHQTFLNAKRSVLKNLNGEPEVLKAYQETELELFGKINRYENEPLLVDSQS